LRLWLDSDGAYRQIPFDYSSPGFARGSGDLQWYCTANRSEISRCQGFPGRDCGSYLPSCPSHSLKAIKSSITWLDNSPIRGAIKSSSYTYNGVTAFLFIQLENEKNYVIIDDDKSLYDLPVEFKHALIVTSPLVGLNEDIADQAIEVPRRHHRFH